MKRRIIRMVIIGICLVLIGAALTYLYLNPYMSFNRMCGRF